MIDYDGLNQFVPPGNSVSDAWRRVLSRLGDDTARVVRMLNLRPQAVTLHAQTASNLLVRISTLDEHFILRAAPEDDLAGYVYFNRIAIGQGLPVPAIIQRDLTRTLVPFAYTLERYVPGQPGHTVTSEHLQRALGRQAGRILRRVHRIRTPGVGRPTLLGRWVGPPWPTVLRSLGERIAPPPFDELVFGAEVRACLTATLEHTSLECAQPVLIHGAFGPAAVHCTAGEHIQLEALVEPGSVIAGDGLFDLACGLAPVYPAPWREGLWDGYMAVGYLDAAAQERLKRLRLLTGAWLASAAYMRAEPHEEARDAVLRMVAEAESSGC
jgi:hypothetical protein